MLPYHALPRGSEVVVGPSVPLGLLRQELPQVHRKLLDAPPEVPLKGHRCNLRVVDHLGRERLRQTVGPLVGLFLQPRPPLRCRATYVDGLMASTFFAL